MAAPIPPPTAITGPCSGLSYSLPLPGQHVFFDITNNSVPGPLLKLNIAFRAFPVNLGIPRIFSRIPIVDNDCEKFENEKNLLFPGVPCDATTCSKRVCKRIAGIRVCENVPYPCPKLIGKIYLGSDRSLSVTLFTIPRLALQLDGRTFSNIRQRIQLLSNSPLVYWIELLAQTGYDTNGINNPNDALNRLLVVGARTMSYLLRQLALLYVRKKLEIELSIRLRELVVDIRWELRTLRLVAGNRVIQLTDLSYTFKNIDVLKLIQADYLEFKVSNTSIVFEYVLGNFDLGVNPLTIITDMIRDKINSIKAIPGTLNARTRRELANLENALNYIDNLGDEGDLIPFINIKGLNFVKKFLQLLTPKLLISIRICPLTFQVGLCCKIIIDFAAYFRMIGEFLTNQVKSGLNAYKKYTKFAGDVLNQVPILNQWNDDFERANKKVVDSLILRLDLINSALAVNTQDFLSSATICAPL
jgi:hypothetical protein